MIPILYRNDELNFTSNGIGRLADCVSCTVTEERNGIYECEFQYPITGKHYKFMIENGGIVGCIHDDQHDVQFFDIYAYSAPIDGIVTFNAHHISYRLAHIIAKPFEAHSCAAALNGLGNNAVTPCPFTFWTDKNVSAHFTLEHPDNIRAVLGGQQGSILDVYGKGDYEFDRFDVKLWVNRGINTYATIRYGKNMRDIERKYDSSQTYTAVAPYWAGEDGEIVTLPEWVIVSPDAPVTTDPWTVGDNDMTDDHGEEIWFQYTKIAPVQLDLSDSFDEMPTVEELRQAAYDFLDRNQPWLPDDNITVDFVQLWQTPEYENVAVLQRFKLCDTVSIFYPELGITQADAKIIKVVYNVLLESYDSMEIGTPTTTLADALTNQFDEEIELKLSGYATVPFMESAITYATQKITGGLGGHVVFNQNADGEPQEILIMDTDDINTAVNVIRMNKNGIGFSQTGYQGPFTSAWTIDGKFNANFIATGTLLANFIRGGTLTLGGLNNQSGVLQMLDANGDLAGWWNNGYFQAQYEDGYIQVGTPGFIITAFDTHLTASGIYSTGSGRVGGLNMTYSVGSDYRVASIAPGYLDVFFGTVSGSQIIDSTEIRFTQDSGNWAFFIPNTVCRGNFTVNGTKSRAAEADDFGVRTLYCYETPSPLFGDIGEGVIDETGYCYVFLDPVFAETISVTQYQVFLQRYGQGDCYIAERKPDYFVVCGEPGLAFGWELKAKQKDFDQLRLEKIDDTPIEKEPDYGELGCQYYSELEEGRVA